MIMIYSLSFFIKNNSDFSDKDLKGNISQTPPKAKKPSVKKPATKIVQNTSSVTSPTPAKTKSDEKNEQEEANSQPPPAQQPPPTPPTQEEIEFIGTVTAVSGNMVTFSYGSSQTVVVKVKNEQLSSLNPGTRAHVHAEYEDGVYEAKEIEIL